MTDQQNSPQHINPEQHQAAFNPPQQPYPQPPKRYPEPTAKPKKKHRIFLWIFLAVQALFILWIILGASSANGTPTDCGSLDADTCNGAEAVGATIGVALVVGLWMVVDFLMGVTYGVYRLAKRP